VKVLIKHCLIDKELLIQGLKIISRDTETKSNYLYRHGVFQTGLSVSRRKQSGRTEIRAHQKPGGGFNQAAAPIETNKNSR
jgi:hypothetical protein